MSEGWIHHSLCNAVTQRKQGTEKAARKLVGAVRYQHLLLVLWEAGWV